MKLRAATLEDMPDVMDCADRFYWASAYREFMELDVYSVADTLRKLVLSAPGSSFFSVLEDDGGTIFGGLGATLVTHWVTGKLCSSEIFWWVDEARRGYGRFLLRDYETWSKTHGATFAAIELPFPWDQAGEVIVRLGYSPLAAGYIKRL